MRRIKRPKEELQLGKRRPPIEIMRQLLVRLRNDERRAVQADGGAQPVIKRELMREANLNHAQLNRYLDLLEKQGLASIAESDHGLTITVTQTGEAFIEKTGRLVKFLQSGS